MKKRVRKIANFFAFNLLFFALYLNFIHKDKMAVAATPQNSAFSGTVLVNNSDQAIEKKNEATVAEQQTAPEKATENSTVALKLSIN
jgi:uncharacterized membrane-anchored protein YitT (DUF2179 family)